MGILRLLKRCAALCTSNEEDFTYLHMVEASSSHVRGVLLMMLLLYVVIVVLAGW